MAKQLKHLQVNTIAFCFIHYIHHDVLSCLEATVAPAPTTTTITTTASPVYMAIMSGDFSDTNIWQTGQIPSAGCSIIIPPTITVTFTGSIFDIEVVQITIGGTFAISSTTDFTFQYAINIIIEDGGSFNDQTTTHKIYCFAGTIWTFYAGASFTGLGTIAYQYTKLPASANAGASYTFGGSVSGPFTFGVLFNGEIQTFGRVTCIAGKSGGFKSRGTWLGGIVPTVDFCDFIGGCGLYVSSGCDLDTSELNGQLDINFNDISIASGGSCSLGRRGFGGGFRFKHRCSFNCRGQLNFLSSSGGIYLPWGSACNFFNGARISSNIGCDFRTYDPKVGGLGSLISSFTSAFSGSFYAGISLGGVKTETSSGNMTCSLSVLTRKIQNKICSP